MADQPHILTGFHFTKATLASFSERCKIIGHMDNPTPTVADIPPGTAATAQAIVSTGSVGLSDAMMAALPRLSLFCCYGTGYERVDLEAARRRNIMITHGADANAPDVAELAVGILLASTRRLVRADKMIRRGEWKQRIPNRFGAIAGLTGGRVGILGPWTPALIGDLNLGGAGERSGLRKGDLVLAVGDVTVVDGQQLRDLIRASVRGSQPLSQVWRIERAGQTVSLTVQPEVRAEGSLWTGRIGAFVGAAPAMTTVRRGALDGLWHGARRTWEVSILTLRMMGRMVVGEASLKNISGPLTIADYAGKSASLGATRYLIFLALISVSLGVLNLLPLPVLDGGHLMYYLWEGVTGRTVSDAWMDRLQRSGVALLLVMMSIALFNDVTRLFG